MKRKCLFVFLLINVSFICFSQSKRALFLGNSYTNANNLPQIVADIAFSTGDSLIVDMNTPGGYRLKSHSTNVTSLTKIASGNWDFVVLQEQSQLPSFPESQVEVEVYPYAKKLDSIVNIHNACGETVFYMTWGRKNGDASNCPIWPPVCTYYGMDSLLSLRYKTMADTNNALVSPVGAVWKYIRQYHPQINLYQPDESHPSLEGSYAAACCFYTTFFRKDPNLISFNSTLNPAEADLIKDAVKIVVYDSLLKWHIGEYDVYANFNYTVNNNQVTFNNLSGFASSNKWYFGDGDSSILANPTHLYASSGTFTVTLIAEKCGQVDTFIQTVSVNVLHLNKEVNNTNLTIKNPIENVLKINSDEAFLGAEYSIYDITGRILHSGIINSTEQYVNTMAWKKGIYFLRIENEVQKTWKIVKD